MNKHLVEPSGETKLRLSDLVSFGASFFSPDVGSQRSLPDDSFLKILEGLFDFSELILTTAFFVGGSEDFKVQEIRGVPGRVFFSHFLDTPQKRELHVGGSFYHLLTKRRPKNCLFLKRGFGGQGDFFHNGAVDFFYPYQNVGRSLFLPTCGNSLAENYGWIFPSLSTGGFLGFIVSREGSVKGMHLFLSTSKFRGDLEGSLSWSHFRIQTHAPNNRLAPI